MPGVRSMDLYSITAVRLKKMTHDYPANGFALKQDAGSPAY
jgi:hypothetical protein